MAGRSSYLRHLASRLTEHATDLRPPRRIGAHPFDIASARMAANPAAPIGAEIPARLAEEPVAAEAFGTQTSTQGTAAESLVTQTVRADKSMQAVLGETVARQAGRTITTQISGAGARTLVDVVRPVRRRPRRTATGETTTMSTGTDRADHGGVSSVDPKPTPTEGRPDDAIPQHRLPVATGRGRDDLGSRDWELIRESPDPRGRGRGPHRLGSTAQNAVVGLGAAPRDDTLPPPPRARETPPNEVSHFGGELRFINGNRYGPSPESGRRPRGNEARPGVRIGSIEVVVTPPPPAPAIVHHAPTTPPAGPLSRGFTATFGLRQG